jgi:hypothetical protein
MCADAIMAVLENHGYDTIVDGWMIAKLSGSS